MSVLDGATPPPLNHPDCIHPSFAHLYTSSEPAERQSPSARTQGVMIARDAYLWRTQMWLLR
jgi:hypothetical protein